MLFLIAIFVHIASIATLFPEVAVKTTFLHDGIVGVGFVLMALATVAHTSWDDEGEVMRSRLARLSLSLGITYVGLLVMASFGLSFGPANPFGAPEDGSLQMRVGWFVGFTLIASLGARFFVATSVLSITELFAGPIRRSPILWLLVSFVLGGGAGFGAVLLLHSDKVAKLAANASQAINANPGPYLIGFMTVPMLLRALTKMLPSRSRTTS